MAQERYPADDDFSQPHSGPTFGYTDADGDSIQINNVFPDDGRDAQVWLTATGDDGQRVQVCLDADGLLELGEHLVDQGMDYIPWHQEGGRGR